MSSTAKIALHPLGTGNYSAIVAELVGRTGRVTVASA
jgi:hypothetical protein